MAININYAPNIAALGQLAFAGGYGQRRNEQNDQALRMAMQERQFTQQMQQQDRQQQFARDRDMWAAGLEDQRYARNWADKMKAEEQDRAWREKQGQVAFDRQQQAANEASQRAVKQDLEIKTQQANLHDQKLAKQLHALNMEIFSRDSGTESSVDPNLRGADYGSLIRMRDGVLSQYAANKEFIQKDKGYQLAPGLWYTDERGPFAYSDPRERPEKTVKPTGMQTDEYWDKKIDARTRDIIRSSEDNSTDPEGKDVISYERARAIAEREIAPQRSRYKSGGAAQEAMDLYPYLTAGSFGPQMQQAGQDPVTVSPSGASATIGATGQPMQSQQVANRASMPTVSTEQEVASLPVGTKFIFNGVVHTRK